MALFLAMSARPPRRLACGLVWGLSVLVVGCGNPPDRQRATDAGRDVVDARVSHIIGLVEGPEEYLFGRINSVAADDSGRVYVADRIGSTVRVYDRDGRFLRWLGREGGGPGEYRWPADMTFGADGRLYIRDGERITVLEPVTPGGIPDSVVATYRLPGYPNLGSRRGRSGVSGDYYYPHYNLPREGLARYFYLVFSEGEHRGDTIHVPRYSDVTEEGVAYYMLDSGTGRVVRGLAHAPFEPVSAWDLTPLGTVIGGDGARYVLMETDASGDTVGVIQGVRPARRPVPAGELADSMRALRTRVDTLPVPLSDVRGVSQVVASGVLPDSLPAFRSVHVGTNGDVWVEQWPAEGRGDRRVFDVFAAGGAYRGSVSLPVPVLRDPPPFFTDRAVYGVVRDPDTEIERVAVMPYALHLVETGASTNQ